MARRTVPGFPRMFPIAADVERTNRPYDPTAPYTPKVAVELKQYEKNLTASGGTVSHTTETSFKNEINLIVIRPIPPTTTYKVEIKETGTGIKFEEARATRKGEYLIWKPFPSFDDTITISITEANPSDASFNIKVRYR